MTDTQVFNGAAEDAQNVVTEDLGNEIDPSITEGIGDLVTGVIEYADHLNEATKIADCILAHPIIMRIIEADPKLSQLTVNFKIQSMLAKITVYQASTKLRDGDLLEALQQHAEKTGGDPSIWTIEHLQAEADKRKNGS